MTGKELLQEILTATEAAEIWGLGTNTVRQACSGYSKAPPRFTTEECRQSGRTWLITKEGMYRLFGEPKAK